MPSLAFWRRKQPKSIERFNGREMHDYLKRHPTVLYRYQPNSLGLGLLLFLAIASGAFAVATLMSEGFGGAFDWTTVIVLLVASTVLLSLMGYWAYYTHVAYLATSDRHLLVGRGAKMIAIEWRRLTSQKLGFDELEDGQDAKGVMELLLEDYTCKVRLFSRYVVLANLAAFMATMLSHLAEAEERAAKKSPAKKKSKKKK